jgi:predicted peptidase
VLDVIEVVSKMVPIDPKRVFLTGHCMGAMGTWAIGFEYPDRFAALAPVAGVSNVSAALLASTPQMPALLVQGGKDALVVPRAANQASEVAKASLKSFTYQEWPDAGHFTIGTVSVPAILDFFDRAGATSR